MLQHTNAKSLSTVLHVSDRLVTSDYCCQSVGEQSTETQQRVVLKDKFQQYIFSNIFSEIHLIMFLCFTLWVEQPVSRQPPAC